MFIASSFIRAPGWNQPKCQSTSKYINKMGYVHKVEYDLAIERSTLLIHVNTWMSLVKLC